MCVCVCVCVAVLCVAVCFSVLRHVGQCVAACCSVLRFVDRVDSNSHASDSSIRRCHFPSE